MKLTINQSDLTKLFSLASPCIEERSEDRYLSAFHIKVTGDMIVVRGNNTVAESIVTMTGLTEVEGDMEFCVDNFIMRLLEKMKGKLTLEQIDQTLVVKNKKNVHRFDLLDISEFPPEVKKRHKYIDCPDPKGLLAAVNKATPAVSNLPDVPIYQAFAFNPHNHNLTTTDTFQIVECKLPWMEGNISSPPEYLFRRVIKLIEKLGKEDKLQISFGPWLYMTFYFGDNVVAEYKISSVEGEMPEALFDLINRDLSQPLISLTLNRKALSDGLRQCILYSERAHREGEPDETYLETYDEGLRLRMNIHGLAEMKFGLDNDIPPVAFSLPFSARDMLEQLDTFSSDNIEIILIDEEAPFVIFEYDGNTDKIKNDFIYIQSTMEISGPLEEKKPE